MTPTHPSPTKSLVTAAMVAGYAILGGCSISPKPEPPIPASPVVHADDVQVLPARDYGDPAGVQGGPGSASPTGAFVRVWNLDSSFDPVDALVEADGSFSASLDLNVGNEVRVQVVAGDLRSSPVDFVVTTDTGAAQLAHRALGDCLLLDPPLEAVFSSASSVVVHNDCAFDVQLAPPAFRRTVAGLTAGEGTAWPSVVASGATVTVSLDAQPGTGTFEEILFLRAITPQADRRPITARGRAP